MAATMIYALEHANWRWWSATGLLRLPGCVRVRSYPRRADALKAQQRLEAAVRARANPFRCGGEALHFQTSLPPPLLHDWAVDLGLTPPGPAVSTARWAEWWDTHQASLTPSQRDRMWQALDRLRFYEVVERPVHPTVHVLLQINWVFNEQWYDAEPEGGLPELAFHTSASAFHHAREAQERTTDHYQEIAEAAFDDPGQFSLRHRWQALDGSPDEALQLFDPADVAFHEVAEVELAGDRRGREGRARKLYLVVRLGWRLSDRQGPVAERYPDDTGTPVRAFASRAAATRCCQELTAEARREVSPFRFEGGQLARLTSLSEPQLRARLTRSGAFPPPRPPAPPIAWPTWWDEVSATMTDHQRDGVWDCLDRLRFYEVFAVDEVSE